MKILILMIVSLTLYSCASLPGTDKRAFLLTSEESENSQGADAYKEILSKEKIITNTKAAKIVEDIGNELAKISGKPEYVWEFKTIDSPNTPNAFCLPGGKVAVYTGLFPYAQNEAGLAAVMGHEIGHALLRHGGQRMSQQMATNAAMAGLAVIGLSKMDSTKKTLILAALGAGATYGVILPFSRSHETEADEIGLVLMAKAGYDPREAVNFWDRFAKADGGKSPPEFLSTHPNSHNRKEYLKSLLPKVMPYYEASKKKGLGRNLIP